MHDAHPAAVEADLIAAGLRWRDIGTGRTNWRDVWAILTAADFDSAIYRALKPEEAAWASRDTTNHLLANVFDALAVGNWQRGNGKGRKPKPLKRPGVGPDREVIEMDRFDSPAAFDEWWASN